MRKQNKLEQHTKIETQSGCDLDMRIRKLSISTLVLLAGCQFLLLCVHHNRLIYELTEHCRDGQKCYDENGLNRQSIPYTTFTSYSPPTESKVDNINYETAIIISTHLVPSHPSLSILKETMDSWKYLSGLPANSQIIITVDGLADNTSTNRKSYFLLKSNENENRRQQYIAALKEEFRHRENIKIMVNERHGHLGNILKNAVELLDPRTEFVYILQQDLPFIRNINHTAIVKTRREYPEYVRLVRFSHRPNPILNKIPCWNQTEPVQSVNGIHLHKTSQWSDMNHWVDLKFYREHILSKINLNNFPEVAMQSNAAKNCSFYGPHMYGLPGEKAFVKHTDGAERYGQKLKTRIANGAVKIKDLRLSTIREENISIPS